MRTLLPHLSRVCSRTHCAAVATLILLTATASADAADPKPSSSRYRLEATRIAPAPLASTRYSVSARFAAPSSAGELREGGARILLGRLAKAGVSCDGFALFGNGFEGN